MLSEEEVRTLWIALDAEHLQRPVAALRLGLLTAQRPGEITRMCWQDVSEERSGWWWTIPAELAKNGRAHRVPLSAPAKAVLDTLPRDGGGWVPPGRFERTHLIETSLARHTADLRQRLGMEPFTPHDLRRTTASHMKGQGVSRLVVKKLLNHVDSDVTAIYDRHGYDAEKRAALDAWGTPIAKIVAGPGMIKYPTRGTTHAQSQGFGDGGRGAAAPV